MRFRVFATRIQQSPPPYPMQLELTLREERMDTGAGAAFSRTFETVDQISRLLADAGISKSDAGIILRPCDLAERQWNTPKTSDGVVSLDRKQLQTLGFVAKS